MGWLESNVRDSVNHSFVALIFRIVLERMGGLGPSDFLLLGFSFWK